MDFTLPYFLGMEQIFILVKDQLQYFFRSKKAVIFSLLYLVVFLLVIEGFITLQSHFFQEVERQGVSDFQRDFMMTFARISFLNGSDSNVLLDFLFTVPVFNIVFFLVSLVGTPILIILLNFDRFSQEMRDGTFRYLIFRIPKFPRWKIYVAKFLGSLLEVLFATAVAFILALVWSAVRIQGFDFWLSFTLGVRYLLIGLVFLSAVVSYVLLFSVCFKRVSFGLYASIVFYFVSLVFPWWVRGFSLYDPSYMEGLFHADSVQLTLSLLAYFLFSLLFNGLGFFIFHKRDL